MNIFEQVEAMHQQVREFVEKEYPEFKVTRITAESTTQYAQPIHALLENPDYILTENNPRFRVQCENYIRETLDCEVFVTNDGEIRTGNVSRGTYYYRHFTHKK